MNWLRWRDDAPVKAPTRMILAVFGVAERKCNASDDLFLKAVERQGSLGWLAEFGRAEQLAPRGERDALPMKERVCEHRSVESVSLSISPTLGCYIININQTNYCHQIHGTHTQTHTSVKRCDHGRRCKAK